MTGIKTYKESMDTNDFQHFSKFITNVIETDVDNKVVKENLHLEEEILNLRRILKDYETRKN